MKQSTCWATPVASKILSGWVFYDLGRECSFDAVTLQNHSGGYGVKDFSIETYDEPNPSGKGREFFLVSCIIEHQLAMIKDRKVMYFNTLYFLNWLQLVTLNLSVKIIGIPKPTSR
eukprot:UN26439